MLGLGVTVDDLEALEKALYASDNVGVQQLLIAGRVVPVPNGTKVLVIDLQTSGFLGLGGASYRVRVVEGKYAGLAGWTRGDQLAAP